MVTGSVLSFLLFSCDCRSGLGGWLEVHFSHSEFITAAGRRSWSRVARQIEELVVEVQGRLRGLASSRRMGLPVVAVKAALL